MDTKLTLKDFLEEWLKENAHHLKPRTVSDYRYDIEKYITPSLGTVKLEKLTPLQIQRVLSELAGSVSPDRANKVRRILYGALKQAVRWQI